MSKNTMSRSEKAMEQSRVRTSKWHIKNRARHLEYLRMRRINFPRAVWGSKIKAKFGITADDYDALLLAQGGVCAICGMPETDTWKGITKRLAIDHCHLTKRVRGLLCGNCNKGMGHLKESPEIILNLAKYLEKHS